MTGIYVSSKIRYAESWRRHRLGGMPIISTWIDEAGPGESTDLVDLWERCVDEASGCTTLLLFRDPADDSELKGGWVEVGCALACGRTVHAVGVDGMTLASHPLIRVHHDLEAAAWAAIAEHHDVIRQFTEHDTGTVMDGNLGLPWVGPMARDLWRFGHIPQPHESC